MNLQPINILLVEDNPGDARLVLEMLREDGFSDFRLTHVTTVKRAVDQLAADPTAFEAILLDLSLPDESGLDTLRRVVAVAGRASVVVMTGAGDEKMGLEALQDGAQDYLVKGQVDGRMLRRALRYAIERHDMRLELQSLTLRDDLTGLNNRRGFLVLAEQQVKVARRHMSTFLLLFLDLDDLKLINDTFGHAEGNRALVEAADVLRACFRQSDILARIGGDEFAAFAISSAESGEASVRHRLQTALRLINAKPDRAYPLGFSVGILPCLPSESIAMDVLLERADRLMYTEKRRKRGAPLKV